MHFWRTPTVAWNHFPERGFAVAYPELVSRGVSKGRKFKWLVKVCACKHVNPLI